MRLMLHCPFCAHPLQCDVSRTGGDIVPYGSTTARLPEGLEVNPDEIRCPGCGLDFENGEDAIYESLTTEAEKLVETSGVEP